MASIPAMAINSAVKGGFFSGLSRGVGKTISHNIGSRRGSIMAESGISNRITAGMQHGWAGTGGTTIRGIQKMHSNWTNPYKRGYGAGMAIGGLGTAWVGMGVINIVRPGDNIGLF